MSRCAVEPDFRMQYEERGRCLLVRGTPIEHLSREELIAVIGFLFEKISAHEPGDEYPGHRPDARELDWEYPTSNNGLFEG
jgi:hypothetical protein